MPEIPEVEAFKNYFKDHCLHKVIVDIKITDKKVIKTSTTKLRNELLQHKFLHVQRQGKFLVIDSDHSEEKLVMHFGLTGYLCYTKNAKTKVKFSIVRFVFNDGSVLHWNSMRKFGKIWLVDSIDCIKELKNLGPDALKITQAEFLAQADKNKKKNIKAFLTDQTIIAGIGNEYSDEMLFQVGVNPHHILKDLSKSILIKLYKQMRAVLKYAIKVQIKNSAQEPGQPFFTKENRLLFKSSYLQAHRHIDLICPKNKNHTLKIEKIDGRTTYYCPKDQK